MKRILIIGCGGSGKSTLAIALGRTLDIPVHHLDRLFWKPGWVESEKGEFEARLQEILNEDTWIMDGNYSASIPMRVNFADTIIFLDLPTLTCAMGALRRRWQYRGVNRPDMTEGNAERIDLNFLGWILSYRSRRRPRILALLESLDESKRVLVLKSRKEIAEFLGNPHIS